MSSGLNVPSEATNNQPKLLKYLGSALGDYVQPSFN